MYHPDYKRVLLTIQTYDFEIKYIPGKEVALADAVSRVNPQDEMGLKGLDFTTWIDPVHDTNADVNDMCWTEVGYKKAVINPRVCFKGFPSAAKRWTQPSRYWVLRHDFSIEDGCIPYLDKVLIPANLWE